MPITSTHLKLQVFILKKLFLEFKVIIIFYQSSMKESQNYYYMLQKGTHFLASLLIKYADSIAPSMSSFRNSQIKK